MKNATKGSSSSFGLFGKRTMRIREKKNLATRIQYTHNSRIRWVKSTIKHNHKNTSSEIFTKNEEYALISSLKFILLLSLLSIQYLYLWYVTISQCSTTASLQYVCYSTWHVEANGLLNVTQKKSVSEMLGRILEECIACVPRGWKIIWRDYIEHP